MKSRPAAVIFILVTVTLDILAMGLIIPVLPKLILDFLGGEMTDAAKWSARFAVVFALMQFFCSPWLGIPGSESSTATERAPRPSAGGAGACWRGAAWVWAGRVGRAGVSGAGA